MFWIWDSNSPVVITVFGRFVKPGLQSGKRQLQKLSFMLYHDKKNKTLVNTVFKRRKWHVLIFCIFIILSITLFELSKTVFKNVLALQRQSSNRVKERIEALTCKKCWNVCWAYLHSVSNTNPAQGELQKELFPT